MPTRSNPMLTNEAVMSDIFELSLAQQELKDRAEALAVCRTLGRFSVRISP